MINYLEIGDQTILSTGDIEVVKTTPSIKELVDAENRLEKLDKDIEKKKTYLSKLDAENTGGAALSFLLNGILATTIFCGNWLISSASVNKPHLLACNLVFGSMLASGVAIRLHAKHNYKIKRIETEESKKTLEKKREEVNNKVLELRNKKEVIASKVLIVEVDNSIIPVQPTLIPVPERSNNKEKKIVK